MDNEKYPNIRDSSTNIQSSATTLSNQLSELIKRLSEINKNNIEGLNNFLKFAEEIRENSAKFASLGLSGILVSYSEVISSIATEFQELSKNISKDSKAIELRNILKDKIRTFYASFYDSLEYLNKEVRKQVVSAKIDKIVEEYRKNITNPFIELARHGFKFKKAAEYVQSGIVGLEPGKSIGWGQAISRGATLALGQFGEKLLKLSGILELVSGVFTKITVVSGGIAFLVQNIINFFNYQRQLEAKLGGIGSFRLTSLSATATEFQKGFQKAIGGVFGGLGIGISQIQDAIAQFLGSSSRLFNVSNNLVENISFAFTKAAILGRTFGMSLEESMGNLMKFYSVIGLARGKLYEIYKIFVGLAARANLSFSEMSEIIGDIPQKIMFYGTESVKKFSLSLSNIVKSFGENIELGQRIAAGISSYLNKSLVFQVGMIAAYGDLSKAQSDHFDFISEAYSSLGKFLGIVKNNLGTGPMGTLAFASALGQFFGEDIARLYFLNEDVHKSIDNLIRKGFRDEKDFKKIIDDIKNKTYEERSIQIFREQQTLLQNIINIIEDIRIAIYRIISLFTFGGGGSRFIKWMFKKES
jgi:hypothetical protein